MRRRQKQSSVSVTLTEISRSCKLMQLNHNDKLQKFRKEILSTLRGLECKPHAHEFCDTVETDPDVIHATQLRSEEAFTALHFHIDQMRNRATELAVTCRILDSLRFESMDQREITMRRAYGQTYAWAFNEQSSGFRLWLQQSETIFWISGKAGSGKSTLMKFIDDHPNTMELLNCWAGGRKLAKASFYFWNSGTSMERSQEGLLQKILFEVLRQCPELVRVAAPSRWHADADYHQHPKPWNREELSSAMDNIVKFGRPSSRFAFFIDGLDEYEGDHYALITDLERLQSSGAVKLCVSSRPWNVFVKAYGRSRDRMLRLESLKKHEMDRYVHGMLVQDRRFMELEAQDPGARDLVREIRQRSNGVFFWVYLVVRSLLRGLNEDDDIPMLQRRLQDIPGDLESYFHHMLENVDEAYKEQSSRTLLTVTTAPSPLPAVLFTFLEHEMRDPDFVLKPNLGPMTQRRPSQLRDGAKSLINKWCRDLVQVVDGNSRRGSEDFETYHNAMPGSSPKTASSLTSSPSMGDFAMRSGSTGNVEYLHRTVKDFLMAPEMQRHLRKNASGDFEPRLALCRWYLAYAKFANGPIGSRSFESRVSGVLNWARECEIHLNTTPQTLLLELDRVGCQQSPGPRGRLWYHNFKLETEPYECAAFFIVASHFKLHIFVQQNLTRVTGIEIKDIGTLLLLAALNTTSRVADETPDSAYDIVRMLLQNGMDVDVAWAKFLQFCNARRRVLHQLVPMAQLFFDRDVPLYFPPDQSRGLDLGLHSTLRCLRRACAKRDDLKLLVAFDRATKSRLTTCTTASTHRPQWADPDALLPLPGSDALDDSDAERAALTGKRMIKSMHMTASSPTQDLEAGPSSAQAISFWPGGNNGLARPRTHVTPCHQWQ